METPTGQFIRQRKRSRTAVSLAALAAVLAGPAPALAQDTLAEARLRKMEAEINALQRKVFPGGDDRFFKPQITGNAEAGGTQTASTSAVTDILTRMDALEAQIARLTGEVERNTNRIVGLERAAGIAPPTETVATTTATPGATPTPAAVATPVPTPTPVATPAPTPTPAATPTPTATPAPAPQSNLDAMTGGASSAAPAASSASSERVRAVSAIAKPQTDDPADDEYSYGFRLWDARFYPEAQQQLKIFIDRYPSHWRASWARNLLGRAYLDEGNSQEAAKWFLKNYQEDKAGGRAPDSLLYLAASMKRMNDTKRSCIALAEFSETYAAEAAGRLKGLYDATRSGLSCG